MSTNEDITTRPGFIAKARKALVALVGATAASLGPAIVIAGADGAIEPAGEILPICIIAITLGLGAALAVYATPNAK
ncbi:hypothetical protein [Microbacterium sp. BH-3-3-3]|uniref:hypothetical protein n=1 Tax=Microbacterium sp. BH-3-3-3 TaxID=1906742 RepID=UPI0011A82F05|nr:hypothetical protein [Microbacterium sp. BH-3-3-3]